jgi:hypothetical protein
MSPLYVLFIYLARVLDWPHCFLAAMIAMCCGEWWLSFTRFFIQFVEPAYIKMLRFGLFLFGRFSSFFGRLYILV